MILNYFNRSFLHCSIPTRQFNIDLEWLLRSLFLVMSDSLQQKQKRKTFKCTSNIERIKNNNVIHLMESIFIALQQKSIFHCLCKYTMLEAKNI